MELNKQKFNRLYITVIKETSRKALLLLRIETLLSSQ